MVEKTLHPQGIGRKHGVRALIAGASLTFLAASAVSGSAHAAEILPESDPELQLITLGGENPTELPVGKTMGARLFNSFALQPEGNETFPPENGPQLGLDDEPESNDVGDIGQEQPSSVSEPGILVLFGAGLVALGLVRRRRG